MPAIRSTLRRMAKNVNNTAKHNSLRPLTIVIPLLLLLVVAGVLVNSTFVRKLTLGSEAAKGYKPQINPLEFSATLTGNKYFKLPVGRQLVYEVETEEGLERIEITILDETKKLMDVKTRVYLDRVWLDTNGDKKFSKTELIELTLDYLAQNTKTGDVWYFGEDVNNYQDGKLVDHSGSWLAGKDGALPGIWVKGKSKVGDSYLQEYYAGEAEDTRDVVATGITVKTKKATYRDCVQFFDWTPLDDASLEYKYYCAGSVNALVAAEHLTAPHDEDPEVIDRTELVSTKMLTEKELDKLEDEIEIDD